MATSEINQKVKFDPGFAPLVMDSIGQVGCTYYMFSAINDIKIKKMNFLGLSIKLEKLLKTNISFYMGCLLWASYLVGLENSVIEGNQLLNEECSEEEYTKEIDFLTDFISNQLVRDYKYFLNKKYSPNEKYLPILKAYRDFLVLNKGFCSTSTTNQIIMPDYLKKLSSKDGELVKTKIENAIKNNNLEVLLEDFNILFN